MSGHLAGHRAGLPEIGCCELRHQLESFAELPSETLPKECLGVKVPWTVLTHKPLAIMQDGEAKRRYLLGLQKRLKATRVQLPTNTTVPLPPMGAPSPTASGASSSPTAAPVAAAPESAESPLPLALRNGTLNDADARRMGGQHTGGSPRTTPRMPLPAPAAATQHPPRPLATPHARRTPRFAPPNNALGSLGSSLGRYMETHRTSLCRGGKEHIVAVRLAEHLEALAIKGHQAGGA